MVGIEARTGVDMDTEAVKTAWDMCRFEKAWHPFEQTLPGWCSIFSLEDLELLEWREDLKKYYSDGMGYDINTKMTQPLFQTYFPRLIQPPAKNHIKSPTCSSTLATVLVSCL